MTKRAQGGAGLQSTDHPRLSGPHPRSTVEHRDPLRRTRFRFGLATTTRTKAMVSLTALLLPLAAMVGLAAPAQAATSATATYVKKSDWGTGFEGQWTVKNTGTTALSSWTIEWDFPSGTSVTSAWDATVTSSGTHWTAKNVGWNGTVAPGASVSFGFNGATSAPPPAAS